MDQLSLSLNNPAIDARLPERRIDITLRTLSDILENMTDDERVRLSSEKWWNTIVIVSRVRAMERGEEDVLGRPARGLADVYDQVVQPGEHVAAALLRTFEVAYAQPRSPSQPAQEGE